MFGSNLSNTMHVQQQPMLHDPNQAAISQCANNMVMDTQSSIPSTQIYSYKSISTGGFSNLVIKKISIAFIFRMNVMSNLSTNELR